MKSFSLGTIFAKYIRRKGKHQPVVIQPWFSGW